MDSMFRMKKRLTFGVINMTTLLMRYGIPIIHWFIYNKLINLAFQKGYNINPKSYGIGTDFYNIYIRKFNQIDSNNF